VTTFLTLFSGEGERGSKPAALSSGVGVTWDMGSVKPGDIQILKSTTKLVYQTGELRKGQITLASSHAVIVRPVASGNHVHKHKD